MLQELLVLTLLATAQSHPIIEQGAAVAEHHVTIAAHRGYSAKYPENTLPSFQAAIEHHADFIEFDIRMSKDGIPVIIHDRTVDRTTNGRGPVKYFTLKALQDLDAGSAFRPRVYGCRIPTLQQVLELAAQNGMNIYPEIKGYRSTNDLRYIIKQLIDAGFEDRAVVESFHYRDFKTVRSMSKKIRLGYLAYTEEDVDRALKAAQEDNRVQLFVSHSLLYDSHIIEAAHRVHVPVIAWTVDNPEEFKELIRLGVDGVITNQLEALQRCQNQ